MRMAIKGIGVVGGFGCGVSELEAALANGWVQAGELSVPTGEGPRLVPAFRAQTEALEQFLPKRALRRVDHFSRLGLLGAHLALADAGRLGGDLDRVGVVVASGYGATATTFAYLDSLITDGDVCASPTHFANSVHNAAAANISIVLGAKGPSLTVSQLELSVPSALLSASRWLAEGRVDAVLLGAIDELSDLVGYLQLRRHGRDLGREISPLDAERESSVLGEGAAFFLLTREDGAPAYCAIDALEMGLVPTEGPAFPEDALLVLGADGRRELGRRYRLLVPERSQLACYAPLYGSTPAGAGFDLAAAALVLKRGETYPLSGAAGCDRDGRPLPLCATRLSLLRLAGDNEYARIDMSRI